MKSILLMAGGVLLASVAIAEEVPDALNGQKLFNESRCLECHGVDLFTSQARKVNSLSELESRVRRCDANLSTNWFDDQILDVVAYLNAAYYKFDTASQQSSAESESGNAEPEKTIVSVKSVNTDSD